MSIKKFRTNYIGVIKVLNMSKVITVKNTDNLQIWSIIQINSYTPILIFYMFDNNTIFFISF